MLIISLKVSRSLLQRVTSHFSCSRTTLSKCSARPLSWMTGKSAVATKEGYKHFKPKSSSLNSFSSDWISLAVLGAIPSSLLLYYAWHLDRAPITGRLRMIDISPDREQALGRQSFQALLSNQTILPDTHPASALVRRVGENIAKASGMNLPWEFKVVDSPIVNAACLPGGKVVVFTGLLRLFEFNEEALAAVLAHECAHAMARHQAEQLGFFNLLLWAEFAVNLVLNAPFATRWLANYAGRLPYSRQLESEADHIGLQLLARSCRYRPSAMPAALDRLAQHAHAQGRGRTPDFLSTHPSDASRVEACRGWLPAAEAARAAECPPHAGFLDAFDAATLRRGGGGGGGGAF